MWEPATKARVLKDQEYRNDILSLEPDCLKFWEYLCIEPEKWTERHMGERGGGFWVVAILGKSVIYYNDIEEGYNLSSFTHYGSIDHYCAGQLELHEVIISLYAEITRLKHERHSWFKYSFNFNFLFSQAWRTRSSALRYTISAWI